jgi:proton-translocating NADH-quinone oxidoreductase chain M
MYLPCFGVVHLMCLSRENLRILRCVSLFYSVLAYLLSLCLWFNYDSVVLSYQFVCSVEWLYYLGISYYLGIDGISLVFINLSCFLIVICLICSWSIIRYRLKEFMILLLLLEFCLINVFTVLDIILFYVFFESVLIPMYLMIGIWGSRTRKVHAAYQFFLYTLIGSLLMLLSIVLIHYSLGSTDMELAYDIVCSDTRRKIIWLLFFLSFGVKIPMFPFHIWLPEAHVEAPTAGSVLLAGILLKLGGYGFLRFSLPMFGSINDFYSPLVYWISGLGVLYCSFTTIRQIDMKKIIAYSSVAHMNYVTVGIFSRTIEGIEGGIFLMVSHGLVSSSLFLCVGMLYDRYKTRIISYYNGMATVMPNFSVLFLCFILGNLSFPGTSSFIGELLVLLGIIKVSRVVTFLMLLGVILGGVYSMFLLNRVIFGQIKMKHYSDLNLRESILILHMLVLVLWLGLSPNIILELLHVQSTYLCGVF